MPDDDDHAHNSRDSPRSSSSTLTLTEPPLPALPPLPAYPQPAAVAPSPLLSTLNRLSLSTSRPNLPEREGYAARAMRTVSQQFGVGVPWDKDEVDAAMTRRDSASSTLDTSSILYPTLENHPAPLAHPLLVLDLATLTAVPQSVSNETLLATLLRRLEPWVGEDGDGAYTLVVLAAEDPAGKGKSRALPGVAWWLWHWRRIPRKYRKNLKRLYIVHPSTLTRTVLPVLLPLVSPKSYAKLHNVPSLLSLARRGISLAGIDVPLPTLIEEARVLREKPDAASADVDSGPHGALGWGYSAVASVFGGVGSYLHLTEPKGSALASSSATTTSNSPLPQAPPYWGQDIDHIVDAAGGRVPRVFRELAVTILNFCTDTEGIFRRSAASGLIPPLRQLLDLPLDRQPRIDWTGVARCDPLLPPILFKRLLAGLPAPIIPSTHYPLIRKTYTADDIRNTVLPALSAGRAAVLTHAMHIAHHLLPYEQTTRMTPLALAIVFAPSLIAGNPAEDAVLCLQPGRPIPPTLAAGIAEPTNPSANTLIGVLQTWITEYPSVAGETGTRCQCRIASGVATPHTAPASPSFSSPHRGSMLNPGGAQLAPPLES